MASIRVGGHRYSDPDVLALISSTGELVDPRSAVLHQARTLNAQYRQFDTTFKDPLERVKIIASLQGIKVMPMNLERNRGEKRDAVLMPTEAGKQILYNPNSPKQRIAFSIAHEISHTFFPSNGGARFRNVHKSDSREANELERLCDLGAGEILMPIEDFQRVAGGLYTLNAVDRLAAFFGSSFEATVYRLSTAHPGQAVAGLLQYRVSGEEQRLIEREACQRPLFPRTGSKAEEIRPKYRRQGCYLSQACDESYYIPWNKSFDPNSSVYQTAESVSTSVERIPNRTDQFGRLEAVRAPFQRDTAHPHFADILFFWEADRNF
jgi:Zn-dependent peptidase ImmA (M78 family)